METTQMSEYGNQLREADQSPDGQVNVSVVSSDFRAGLTAKLNQSLAQPDSPSSQGQS